MKKFLVVLLFVVLATDQIAAYPAAAADTCVATACSASCITKGTDGGYCVVTPTKTFCQCYTINTGI
ncbi:hypothetical protein NQ315_003033 [Exocentrus adspersus]|uniref:Invertebrate defensins family profile domain-containing protein n=1 Tax=Exocentrus adspersus TaxID=1586481 RepID=A0AAV8W4C0_9CUCU|nr:hypothetical protein NQ315_003033 [Exocentrus adspersus]